MKDNDYQELSEEQLDALIERVNEAIAHELSLSVEDMQLLLKALLMLAQLQDRMHDKDITVHKLRKLVGIVKSSEKLKSVLGEQKKAPARKPRQAKPAKPAEPKELPIHKRCHHRIEGLKKGDPCPLCERGRLYKYDPAVVLRISGQAPLTSTQHVLERLRCNACGEYFTAEASEEVKQDGGVNQRYGYSARALIAIHKHFAGLPFYRQQSLQTLLGMPLSASSAFDQSEHVANAIDPVVRYLIKQSADALHYHLDDTRNRIVDQSTIEKPDRRTGKPKTRSGLYTSGIIATLTEGHEVVLFQTNIGHAGEWIDEILGPRTAQAPPPIIMGDALSSNVPSIDLVYILTRCNSHARRQFIDVMEHFTEPVTLILKRYGKIWTYDAHCKKHTLSAEQRLAYHQNHSLPIMEQLRKDFQHSLDSEAVEANSGLGQAMQYFLRHYHELTGFCRIAGAQLDNNTMEAALKLVIRGRKNAMFYKTLAGAAIADSIMSLVATCERAQINVFEYLVLLQRHALDVKHHPQRWLPWNYQQALEQTDLAA